MTLHAKRRRRTYLSFGLRGWKVPESPKFKYVPEVTDSLIVDGTAVVESRAGGHRLLIAPARAVLHRPAAAPDPSSPCDADCVPLLPPSHRDGI